MAYYTRDKLLIAKVGIHENLLGSKNFFRMRPYGGFLEKYTGGRRELRTVNLIEEVAATICQICLFY